MAEYAPKAELMAAQQSLLGEYDCQLNKEMDKNVAILSHLSQHEPALYNFCSISTFGTRSKKAVKTMVSTSVVQT